MQVGRVATSKKSTARTRRGSKEPLSPTTTTTTTTITVIPSVPSATIPEVSSLAHEVNGDQFERGQSSKEIQTRAKNRTKSSVLFKLDSTEAVQMERKKSTEQIEQPPIKEEITSSNAQPKDISEQRVPSPISEGDSPNTPLAKQSGGRYACVYTTYTLNWR